MSLSRVIVLVHRLVPRRPQSISSGRRAAGNFFSQYFAMLPKENRGLVAMCVRVAIEFIESQCNMYKVSKVYNVSNCKQSPEFSDKQHIFYFAFKLYPKKLVFQIIALLVNCAGTGRNE